MAFGDYLREHIYLLQDASIKKVGSDAFWEILKRIAVQEILSMYPMRVDSDTAVPIYYQILSENEDQFPSYFSEKLSSNHQERYRVINRNMWTSNAFHPDGLANQKEIFAYKEINENKKGERTVYQGVIKYVDR